MPATATGRGAQVIIDPISDTAKAIRGAYATTFEANAAKVSADIAAGIASSGNRQDGTTTTTMATDTSVNPTLGNETTGGTLTVTGSRIISQGAGGNPTVSVWDTTIPAGTGFWIDASKNMAFGPVNSAGVPQGQFMALDQFGRLIVQLGVGAFNTTPPTTKPAVTGSKGANAALASLLTALVSYGFITDSST